MKELLSGGFPGYFGFLLDNGDMIQEVVDQINESAIGELPI